MVLGQGWLSHLEETHLAVRLTSCAGVTSPSSARLAFALAVRRYECTRRQRYVDRIQRPTCSTDTSTPLIYAHAAPAGIGTCEPLSREASALSLS